MKRPHFALPEIYDDSLSYYDVLRKLIKSMHVINDNLNKIPEQIANEAKEREQADSTLQTNINNEAMARQEADNELRELISTSGGGVTEAQLNEEATARQQADAVLDGKISELKSDLDNIMPITKVVGFNKFNIDKKVTGSLNQNTGSVDEGIYTVSELIDLTGNTGYVDAYMCSDTGSPQYSFSKYVFYDSNKSYISGFYDSTGENKLENSRLSIPQNAKYVRFEFWNRTKIMVVFDNEGDWKQNWVAYDETNRKNVNQIEDEVDNHEARISDLEVTSVNKWAGKNVLVLGDSISDKRYHHIEITAWDKWAEVLSSKLGFTLTNDSLHASGFLVNMGSKEIGPRSLINRISNHSGETYDMVILFMGINDAINGMPIGTEPTDDKTADFYSAVDYCFNYIKNNFTAARFVVLLPLEAKSDWYAPNQQAYINVLKEECEKYNIPYLDLYKKSGFDAKNDNFRNMFTELGGSNGNYVPDGLHPNQLWDNNYLAPQIGAFIDRFI